MRHSVVQGFPESSSLGDLCGMTPQLHRFLTTPQSGPADLSCRDSSATDGGDPQGVETDLLPRVEFAVGQTLPYLRIGQAESQQTDGGGCRYGETDDVDWWRCADSDDAADRRNDRECLMYSLSMLIDPLAQRFDSIGDPIPNALVRWARSEILRSCIQLTSDPTSERIVDRLEIACALDDRIDLALPLLDRRVCRSDLGNRDVETGLRGS